MSCVIYTKKFAFYLCRIFIMEGTVRAKFDTAIIKIKDESNAFLIDQPFEYDAEALFWDGIRRVL